MSDDRQHISSGSPWELIFGYSRAVRVGDHVFLGGTPPLWPDGMVDPDPIVQARRCMELVEKALMEAGGRLEDVVRTRVYLVDPNDFAAVTQVHGERFGNLRPANTTVIVSALANPDWRVEIEVDAVIGTRVREPSDNRNI
jgi:enamine deaminase RidA (YjgF/YER057c/UK114 family)